MFDLWQRRCALHVGHYHLGKPTGRCRTVLVDAPKPTNKMLERSGANALRAKLSVRLRALSKAKVGPSRCNGFTVCQRMDSTDSGCFFLHLIMEGKH